MSLPPHDFARRNRALAELARARGWVEDGVLDREVSDSGTDLGERLLKLGAVSAEQLGSLREAVEGTLITRGSSGRRGASATDATMKAPSRDEGASRPTIAAGSDSAVTITSSGGPAPSAGAARQTVGPYRVLRELGRGGMGVVYRALHPALGREIALKVLLNAGEATDETLERFRREAALVAKIPRHPHLVQVHDVGRDGDRLYFTMDFVDGRSLRQRVEADGALPVREAAVIAADVAGALEVAHRAGVVHRDVKPHNILLDPAGSAFLSDFGLAKDLAAGAGLTASGEIFGTPAYMSPEQAAGQARHATPASDVYSLGATLYEMLTGHVAFAGNTAGEMLRLVAESDPVSPRDLRPDVPRDLEVVCLHAMRKEPASRYATAAALEADLRRFLKGEPIQARPAGTIERLVARLRRRRSVTIAAAAALLALAVAGGFAGWKLMKRGETEAAEQEAAKRKKQAADAAVRPAAEGRAQVELAAMASRAGDEAEARRHGEAGLVLLREAAALVPDDADVHYEIGRALRYAERPDAAMAEFEAAVRLQPTHALAWFEHGLLAAEKLFKARGTNRRGVAVQRAYAIETSGNAIGGVLFTRTGGGGDDPAAREAATRDFQKVLGLSVAAERAAFGRGVLFWLDGKLPEAHRAFDEAIALDAYFVEALRARAEIVETETDSVVASLDDRRRIHEACPGNRQWQWEYAFSLGIAGKTAEAMELTRRFASRYLDMEAYDMAADVAELCDERDAALEYRKRSFETASGQDDIDIMAHRWFIHLLREEVPGSSKTWRETILPRISPEMAAAQEAQFKVSGMDWKGAALLVRKVPPGSRVYVQAAELGANVEWICGNLDLASRYADAVIENQVTLDAEHFRGQIRLDRGDFAGAVADFETIRRRAPAFNQNLIYLSGARLLSGDATGAAEALEEAVATTQLTDEHRKAAAKFIDGLKEKAKTADTPEKRIALAEQVLASVAILQSLAPDTPRVQRSLGVAQRGLLILLQRMDLDAERWDKSIAAGEAFLKFYRAGGVLYRQAAVRSLQKKTKSALKLLDQAMEAGFDDGSRLDGDRAFDNVRDLPEYAALRARCR